MTVLAGLLPIIRHVKEGGITVVIDDVGGHADLVMAAERAGADSVAFCLRQTSGLLWAPLSQDRCDELDLQPAVQKGLGAAEATAVESVDLGRGRAPGASAAGRAATINALADPSTRPSDLVRPGHVFPLAIPAAGADRCATRAEAAVQLVRLAGCEPVVMTVELTLLDGERAGREYAERFAVEHGLPLLSVGEIRDHRYLAEPLSRVASASLPTKWGRFECIGYEFGEREHVALVHGDLHRASSPLVFAHRKCLAGDVFHSRSCDCGGRLESAISRIAAEGAGVVIYMLDEEGHSASALGLALPQHRKETERDVRAYGEKADPSAAREIGICASTLRDLDVDVIRLLTNNPARFRALTQYGIQIDDSGPLPRWGAALFE